MSILTKLGTLQQMHSEQYSGFDHSNTSERHSPDNRCLFASVGDGGTELYSVQIYIHYYGQLWKWTTGSRARAGVRSRDTGFDVLVYIVLLVF
jgi:hypothetical protein